MKRKRKKQGILTGNEAFTLVELIIVIAIMAILAGLAAPSLIRYIKKARVSRATEEARCIVQAIQTALAAGETWDAQPVFDKTYVDSEGNSHACGIFTNWSLSRAQNNVVVQDTDPAYMNYLVAQQVLEDLASDSGADYKFYRFSGSQTNPIGANCEQFYGQYSCPGIVAAYDSHGNVLFLEYYNYGCLIRYSDGEYKYSKDENFTGTSQLQY